MSEFTLKYKLVEKLAARSGKTNGETIFRMRRDWWLKELVQLRALISD